MSCWFSVVYLYYVSVHPPWSIVVMPLLISCGDSLLWCLEAFRSPPSRKSVYLRYFLRTHFYSFCGDLFVDVGSGYGSALQLSGPYLVVAQDDSAPSVSSKLLPISISFHVFKDPNVMAPW